jgi:hypothetical protein
MCVCVCGTCICKWEVDTIPAHAFCGNVRICHFFGRIWTYQTRPQMEESQFYFIICLRLKSLMNCIYTAMVWSKCSLQLKQTFKTQMNYTYLSSAVLLQKKTLVTSSAIPFASWCTTPSEINSTQEIPFVIWDIAPSKEFHLRSSPCYLR